LASSSPRHHLPDYLLLNWIKNNVFVSFIIYAILHRCNVYETAFCWKMSSLRCWIHLKTHSWNVQIISMSKKHVKKHLHNNHDNC
jgi:hypothetical protein